MDGVFLLRRLADSNRRTRFCRPLPSHSAKAPNYKRGQIYNKFLTYSLFLSSVRQTVTRSTSAFIGGQILETQTVILSNKEISAKEQEQILFTTDSSIFERTPISLVTILARST